LASLVVHEPYLEVVRPLRAEDCRKRNDAAM